MNLSNHYSRSPRYAGAQPLQCALPPLPFSWARLTSGSSNQNHSDVPCLLRRRPHLGRRRCAETGEVRPHRYQQVSLQRDRGQHLGGHQSPHPSIEIYLYEDGTEASNFMDTWSSVATYGIGRYNVSRGHSMGSLNGNHPELFQLDSLGNRLYSLGFSNPPPINTSTSWTSAPPPGRLLGGGGQDRLRQSALVADGVHADNCVTFPSGAGYPRPPSTPRTPLGPLP